MGKTIFTEEEQQFIIDNYSKIGNIKIAEILNKPYEKVRMFTHGRKLTRDKKYIEGTKIEDLIGQKFSKLTVVSFIESKNGKTLWDCKCDCGTEHVIAPTATLKNGSTKSCGCITKQLISKKLTKDLTGQKFGRLIVLERDYKKEEKRKEQGLKHRTYWKCKCECGNNITVSKLHLTTGHTQSCGCLQSERASKNCKDYGISQNGSLGDWIINNISDDFIDLYWSNTNLLSPFEMAFTTENQIHIICSECKEEYSVKACNFTRRNQRCPKCSSNSKGEEKISKYFSDNKIEYELHKTFPDLKGVGEGYLSYDFYILDYNLLIEYQGNFHDGSNGTNEFSDVEKQQEHDRRKREYAENHNIKLLEIWYWDFDNIEEILAKELKLN